MARKKEQANTAEVVETPKNGVVTKEFREKVLAYAQEFAEVSGAEAKTLAEEVRERYTEWCKKHHGRGVFLQFVQTIDPAVPKHRGSTEDKTGYKYNSTYQAVTYLLSTTDAEKLSRRRARRKKPTNASGVLAKVLAAAEIPQAALETALKAENWTERAIANLEERVKDADAPAPLRLAAASPRVVLTKACKSLEVPGELMTSILAAEGWGTEEIVGFLADVESAEPLPQLKGWKMMQVGVAAATVVERPQRRERKVASA